MSLGVLVTIVQARYIHELTKTEPSYTPDIVRMAATVKALGHVQHPMRHKRIHRQ